MLFHITIGHSPTECPGRRPNNPPEIVAPSDTRDALGLELGVKLHFVLWGASCVLWAQPEHLAFAVLEADDVESVMQYVGKLVPPGWTYDALPVWNLPAQLRLIRQVRVAPPMEFGQALPTATSPLGLPEDASPAPPQKSDAPPQNGKPVVPDVPARAPATGLDSPGTITRLLRDLDNPIDRGGGWDPGKRLEPTVDNNEPNPSTTVPTRIGESIPTPRAARAWLVATLGPSKGKSFIVDSAGGTIGRLPENAVYIPDERLSREHARIECIDGEHWLSDLNSTNGTALNGSLITQAQRLQSGDTIELGSNVLVVTIEPTSAP